VRIAVNVGPFVVKNRLLDRYFVQNASSYDDEIERNSITDAFNQFLKQFFKINGDNDDRIKYPTMLETIIQAIAIMQENIYELKTKNVENMIEVRPPLDSYSLVDFYKSKEILQIGYEEGLRTVKKNTGTRQYVKKTSFICPNLIKMMYFHIILKKFLLK